MKYVSRPIAPSAPGAQTVSPAFATIPLWQGTSGAYNFQMVGTNPMVAGAGTTSIPTRVIPLILNFSDGTGFDPTISSACSSQSPQSLLLSSPLFNNSAYTVGGTTVGNTQFTDFFQRGNFWQFTGPAGISPNYHILLSVSPGTAITIPVPAASGRTVNAPCGTLGEMDINWFDRYLQATVFPQLAAAGVPPSTLPVFLIENVVMYDTTPANCCILGYHSGFSNPAFQNALQTYAVADFDTSGDFGSTKDIASLSHELSEWLDDPTGANPTPAWGNTGQVTGCQSNLEVGDPLSGSNFTVTMSNSYTYHLQEEAFKSWFYRDTPSSGVNGWYSSNGTFLTPSTPCNTTTTTLTINPATLSPGSAASIGISVTHKSGVNGSASGTVTLVTSLSSTPLATYTLTNGSVSATTTALPAGSYTVTAHYAGDANFAPSVSAPVAVNVGSASVTLSPVALTFASTAVGSSTAAQPVTLANHGTAGLTITSISFTGASPGDYTQTNNCGASLAVNASCQISVSFKPTLSGTRTASLSVADNLTGSPQTVSLTGTATGGASAPKVTLSVTSVAFPATPLGSAATAPGVTVTNSGNAPLTGLAVSLTGVNPGDFSQTNTCPVMLAAGLSCSVTVTFKPTVAAIRAATLSIADSATGSPQTVTLSGTGTAQAAGPVIAFSAPALAFPATTLGATSATQSFTVTNTGTAALTFASISLAGTNAADFTGSTTCRSPLNAGAACGVTLAFRPRAAGARSGAVQFVDNAGGSPQSVALSGTGVAALTGK